MWTIILIVALVGCMFAIFLLVEQPKEGNETFLGEDFEEMKAEWQEVENKKRDDREEVASGEDEEDAQDDGSGEEIDT